METGENHSSHTTFIHLGFGNLLELRVPLFVLFLVIYDLSIVGNLLIILLIAVDQRLHTPMYFLLMNLSCLETCSTSTILTRMLSSFLTGNRSILPRMLSSFLTGNRSISIWACIMQCFFFAIFSSTECYLLSMMSYDRYLAICKPLHYTSLMNDRLCLQLASISWVSGLLTSTILTCLMLQLTFCGPHEIDHFFCDIYPVLNLSCSNLYFAKHAAFVLAFLAKVPPFTLTLVSYICIILTILGIPSKTSQQKSFSTCSSHLTVVILFFVSLFIVYVVPETETLKELHKTFSLFYTVLTPLLNPLIYSLRNREVKEALFRTTRKFINKVS